MTALSLLLSLFLPPAFAANLQEIGTQDPSIAAMWALIVSLFPTWSVIGGSSSPALLAVRVLAFLFRLIGAVAVVVIIYAGIRMIASQGDEAGYTEAKKIVAYALAGLALAIIADRIVVYVCAYAIPLVAGGGYGQCPL